MKIGIDISQIVHQGTGVARYTQGLVEAIIQYEKKNQWIFFFSSLRQKLPAKLIKAIKSKGFILKQYPVPPTLLSVLWNRFHWLDLELFTGQLDWFISSDWIEPPCRSAKKATIIHDLVFLRYPQTVFWKILKTQQQRLVHVCRESDLIFADSYSTKNDIEQLLTLEKAQVKVVYPGVRVNQPEKKQIQQTLKQFNLQSQRFILSVGKLEPRKNLERLIEAYKKIGPFDYPLLIVGPKGWGSLNLSGQNVIVVGYVSNQQLYSLYQSCLFFIYPSLYEGFGYPLIEAATLGASIASSKTSSLGELGKEISLQFNPESVADIAEKMQKLIANKQLRQNLKDKAIQKASEFTWKRSYQQLISYLEQK